MNLYYILILFCLLCACGNQKEDYFSKGEFKQWAQTPPVGWNSWDCYGTQVDEAAVKNSDCMAEKLKEYRWEYIVVDIRWFVENEKGTNYNQKNPIYVLDKSGRYQLAQNRFHSAIQGKGFKSLADYVHSKGLKFGIHIMRGIPKYAVEKGLPIKRTDGITADQIYSTEFQCKWLRDNYTIYEVVEMWTGKNIGNFFNIFPNLSDHMRADCINS